MVNFKRLTMRPALLLSIIALSVGSGLTWNEYKTNSVPPYLAPDTSYSEYVQKKRLNNVLDKYIDILESQDTKSAKFFYQRYGEHSRGRLRGRLKDHLFGYVDKYENIHKFETTRLNEIVPERQPGERKRVVVFNCDWLRPNIYVREPLCEDVPVVLDVDHALYGFIVSELEDEAQNDREAREQREAMYKQLASDKALNHFIWTLTISLLIFVATTLAQRYIFTRRRA